MDERKLKPDKKFNVSSHWGIVIILKFGFEANGWNCEGLFHSVFSFLFSVSYAAQLPPRNYKNKQ